MHVELGNMQVRHLASCRNAIYCKDIAVSKTFITVLGYAVGYHDMMGRR